MPEIRPSSRNVVGRAAAISASVASWNTTNAGTPSSRARSRRHSRNASNVPLADNLHTCCIPHLYYCDPLEGIDPFGQPVTATTLIDIRDTLDQKATALACHVSQREWLRAHQGMDEYIDAMKRHAAARGKLIDSPAAEGFIQHRSHGYPKNDLLSEVL